MYLEDLGANVRCLFGYETNQLLVVDHHVQALHLGQSVRADIIAGLCEARERERTSSNELEQTMIRGDQPPYDW